MISGMVDAYLRENRKEITEFKYQLNSSLWFESRPYQ
jgi:hypothetical protein